MAEDSFIKNTANLFKTLGTDDFGRELKNTLHTQLPFDGSAIILFHPRYSPTVLQEELIEHDEEVFWQNYMRGAYLLDPFYRLCIQGQQGMFHLRDIAPEGFFSSSYYKRYFNPAGINDEINYIFQAPEEVSGMVSITRSAAQNRFSKAERAKLQELSGFVDAAVLRHLDVRGAPFDNVLPNYRPILLQERLDNFSRDILTSREYEIAHLMLRGFSSKASANFLDISPATERTHRKSIYKKMKVNSHAELLAQAFEFLLAEA